MNREPGLTLVSVIGHATAALYCMASVVVLGDTVLDDSGFKLATYIVGCGFAITTTVHMHLATRKGK